DLARRGAAVVAISQDLDEIFEISDRIAVLHHGRLSPAIPAAEMTPERVGLLMGGAHPEAA
ncbi:MAG: ABC transporter, partial [Alphaproteobacteria bacterium HGW-Alphaproteobacteria-10]